MQLHYKSGSILSQVNLVRMTLFKIFLQKMSHCLKKKKKIKTRSDMWLHYKLGFIQQFLAFFCKNKIL